MKICTYMFSYGNERVQSHVHYSIPHHESSKRQVDQRSKLA